MLPAGNIVKKTVKTAFSGKWLNLCVAAFLLVSSYIICALICGALYSFIGETANLVLLAMQLFINFPLTFGALKFYCRAVWGESESPVTVFNVFSSEKEYARALSVSVYLGVRIAVTGILFLAPAILANIFSNEEIYSLLKTEMPLFAPSLSVVSTFLTVIGIFFVLFINLPFYLMPFLMATNDDITVNQAKNLSKTMARRSAPDFCWLALGLSGYILISFFVIPLVFTLPYFAGCYIVHCRFCVAQYNKIQGKIRNTTTFNPKF